MFRRFFGAPLGNQIDPRMFRGRHRLGFIVDRNATHPQQSRGSLRPTTSRSSSQADQDEYKQGDRTDSETDLAVIKIDAGKALAPAKIGNSDGTQVGDWVVAIGSPFGLEATVTAGIVSATAATSPERSSSNTSSRPTRPSTPATPAGRC